MYYSSWRQKLSNSLSPAKQLYEQFVRRYRAGKPVIYQQENLLPDLSDSVVEAPQLYEPPLELQQPLYEPVQYDLTPEIHTPPFRLEPPDIAEMCPRAEESTLDSTIEILSAIEEAKIDPADPLEPPDDLLPINPLFPPPF